MDNIKDKLANISLYDVKAYVRKAQNVVMNYTEMEAKVREATNNEPWGASSTLMQEIAEGTQSYSHFHEIMPMIYKRFTEKSAEEWRQIYKSLQLLEYLVKNGSERVVDYARSHIAVIDMLKHFHYINSEGKDQGINVRNRAKELTALLDDVSKIRAERKLARSQKQKYSGIGSSASSGGFGGSGSKYGGFGSDSVNGEFGGYSGGVYGDGGGFGGNEYDGPGYSNSSRSAVNDDDFEEYEVDVPPTTSSTSKTSKPTPPPQKDLFSFDDSPATSTPAVAPTTAADDDDFADFQSAVPQSSAPLTSTTLPNTSKPLPPSQSDNLFDLFSSPAPTNPSNTATVGNNSTLLSFGGNSSYNSAGAGFGPMVSAGASTISGSSTTLSGSTTTIGNGGSKGKSSKADDAFGSLWASASSKKPSNNSTKPSNLPMASQQSTGSLI